MMGSMRHNGRFALGAQADEMRRELEMGTGRIMVAVRVRPETSEREKQTKRLVRAVDEHMVVFNPADDGRHGNAPFSPRSVMESPRTLSSSLKPRATRDQQFAFDRVFGPEATQRDVYENSTKFLIDGTLEGFNSTVFVYGATGAGKTHTMLGSDHSGPGLMYCTLHDLFDSMKKVKDGDYQYNVKISYLEIYNEMIRDLIRPGGINGPPAASIDGSAPTPAAPSAAPSAGPADKGIARAPNGSQWGSIELREGADGHVQVQGLSWHECKSAQEIMDHLYNGTKNRTMAETEANAVSSRSHAVLQVQVEIEDKASGVKVRKRYGKMSLIDLAGSERAAVSRNRGDRLIEGANINRSLLALGNCINALATGKKTSHVPYRDSKLTRLLKDSLGGNCRTVMIANVSPSVLSYEETLNTLKYANRAKNIKVEARRNVVEVDQHVAQYRIALQQLENESELQKQRIRELEQALAESKDADAIMSDAVDPSWKNDIEAARAAHVELRALNDAQRKNREVLLNVMMDIHETLLSWKNWRLRERKEEVSQRPSPVSVVSASSESLPAAPSAPSVSSSAPAANGAASYGQALQVPALERQYANLCARRTEIEEQLEYERQCFQEALQRARTAITNSPELMALVNSEADLNKAHQDEFEQRRLSVSYHFDRKVREEALSSAMTTVESLNNMVGDLIKTYAESATSKNKDEAASAMSESEIREFYTTEWTNIFLESDFELPPATVLPQLSFASSIKFAYPPQWTIGSHENKSLLASSGQAIAAASTIESIMMGSGHFGGRMSSLSVPRTPKARTPQRLTPNKAKTGGVIFNIGVEQTKVTARPQHNGSQSARGPGGVNHLANNLPQIVHQQGAAAGSGAPGPIVLGPGAGSLAQKKLQRFLEQRDQRKLQLGGQRPQPQVAWGEPSSPSSNSPLRPHNANVRTPPHLQQNDGVRKRVKFDDFSVPARPGTAAPALPSRSHSTQPNSSSNAAAVAAGGGGGGMALNRMSMYEPRTANGGVPSYMRPTASSIARPDTAPAMGAAKNPTMAALLSPPRAQAAGKVQMMAGGAMRVPIQGAGKENLLGIGANLFGAGPASKAAAKPSAPAPPVGAGRQGAFSRPRGATASAPSGLSPRSKLVR